VTASLANSSNGPLGFNIDGFVYPQFLGAMQRNPTTQDIYNEGTRWQNDSVNPPIQWYTTGAGRWFEYPNSSFGVSSVTGTANQILATPGTGIVTLTTPTTFIAPGTIAATSSVTAPTGFFTTPTVVAAGASPQTAAGRTVDVTFSGVSIAAGATQSFVIANTAVPASTSTFLLSMIGATAGAALSIVSVTNVAATSTTIVVTNGTGATTTIANIRFIVEFLN